MVVSATRNTSPVEFGFAEGFGSLATQKQAKDMSKQYLSSKAGGKSTIYDTDINYIKDLASFMGNQANQTYNQRYEKQLKDGMYNQQQAASDKASTDRTAFERQQQLSQQNSNNQRSLIAESNSNQGRGGFIGGATHGVNGGVDPYDYNIGSTSVNRGLYNTSNVAEFNLQQSNTARNNRLFSEANAAGDIARDQAQARNQAYLASVDQSNQIDMMNRQASIEAQNRANDYLRQSRESAAERASRERGQAMDAQSKVYSSMFNSFSSGGNQNYQYWGGRV